MKCIKCQTDVDVPEDEIRFYCAKCGTNYWKRDVKIYWSFEDRELGEVEG